MFYQLFLFSQRRFLSILPTSGYAHNTRRLVLKKTVFSAWASTLNMGLINKVDMVCLSPVGYGVLADVSSVSPSSEQTAPTKG